MAEDLGPLGALDIVLASDGCADPALDMTKDERMAYVRTRDDSLLKFKGGLQPTKFRLEPLPAMFVSAELQDLPFVKRATYAALAACHRIQMPDGKIHAVDARELIVLDHGGRRAPDAWGNRIARKFGPLALVEIGAAALERASLTETDAAF